MISWEDFVAGWIGGSCAVLATHPLDTIRIRMQTNSDAYRSTLSCFKKILKNESPLTFYKGMLGPLIGAGLQNSIVYCVNASVLKYSNNDQAVSPNSWSFFKWLMISSGCAGIGQTIITCPMELVKIRLQVDPSMSKPHSQADGPLKVQSFKRLSKFTSVLKSKNLEAYKGTFRYCHHLWTQKGFFGFYKGYISTIIRDIPGYQSYFFVYTYSNYYLSQNCNFSVSLSQLLAGGMASTISWTFIYPFDVIKSKMQASENQTTMEIVKTIIKSRKIRTLFQGLGPTVIRGFPQGAVSFFVYEKSLEFMSK